MYDPSAKPSICTYLAIVVIRIPPHNKYMYGQQNNIINTMYIVYMHVVEKRYFIGEVCACSSWFFFKYLHVPEYFCLDHVR